MKSMVKVIFLLLALVFVAIAAYLFVPYKKYEYVRTSDTEQMLIVEYLNVTGSPLCSKLYIVEDASRTGNALLPGIPSDLADPNQVEKVSNGKRIRILGFPYEWVATNLITGSVTKKNTGRFDVVAWGDTSESLQRTKQTADPKNFQGKNYIDCLDN